ncbi:XRE family transcriptional regulator [Aquisalimonas lutea]|uniref:helix-turn-helix domain-containing protein n=1 Tax=Aquisalimonas lutea TaxID=1327750 RepID=UPI0025B3096D|nr:XRE family transcriptional regulator [Aquisalimonas lutea]MDN3518312.1 XRE family transcriptional regulator [Aquisalimonas lutea]
MSGINRELIQVGRQLRKMSQTELARQASITQGFLSKIEQGVKEPDDDTVTRLADALGLPESFFEQPDRVYGLPVSVHPMFRKKSKVGVKTLDAIQAELNVRIMHIRRLIKAVDLEASLPLPEFDVDEYHGDPEEIAGLVRRTWLIPRGPIDNLTDYVEQAGVLVIDNNFSGSDIDGVTLAVPGLPPCIFLNSDRPADRRRFTLAHELGHLIMHRIPTPTMEDEANAFASALLMPASDIGPQLNRTTLAKLASLKRVWKVSMAALLMRAKTLGKVSPNQSSYLWRQMGPYRKREPAQLDFAPEKPTVFPELLRLHMDELGYSIDELGSILHVHGADMNQFYHIQEKGGLRLVKS